MSDTGKERHLINAVSQKLNKKPPMNQQGKLVLSGQLSLNTAKETRSAPAVAITRLSVTNYFKNTEKVC